MLRLVLIALFAGCAAGPAPRKAAPPAPPPAWVRTPPPNEDGRVWAIGTCGPTLYPADGLRNAAEDARGKLALALREHVESLEQRTESARGSDGYELDKAATDVLLQNSRIEATWIDEAGQLGDAGSFYALGVVDRSGSKLAAPAALASARGPAWLERLPEASGRIYAIGYSGPTFEPEAARKYAADAAFDNLASSMRAHVQAYSLLIEDRTGLSVEEFSRADDPDEALRTLVRNSAKVEAVWVDAQGVRPGGEKGSVWALAFIEVQSTKGGATAVPNDALAPALDPHGDLKPSP